MDIFVYLRTVTLRAHLENSHSNPETTRRKSALHTIPSCPTINHAAKRIVQPSIGYAILICSPDFLLLSDVAVKGVWYSLIEATFGRYLPKKIRDV
ncbi:hypothetical protein BOTCAL_0038g00280 [Botryotinia calthae]|uniref:Uncharacterized protein n=1 Tax=Botryotinia calthae TaxID=38488 RepID=A0A4Y8DCA3_9HELO|nr:hypothetical protein BOTCAL_0038g00280 [Botryotinia calthae]